ncbi:MAG: hypothetical protein AAF483_14810 [Planctomycetota bacterium]
MNPLRIYIFGLPNYLAALALLFGSAQLLAQESKFGAYAAFARNYEQLGDDLRVQSDQMATLIEQRNELLKGIQESNLHAAQLQKSKQWQSFRLFEAYLTAASMEATFQYSHETVYAENMDEELNAAVASGVINFGLAGENDEAAIRQRFEQNHRNVLRRDPASELMAQNAVRLKTQIDALNHQLKTTNAAGQLVLQRRFENVLELNTLLPKFKSPLLSRYIRTGGRPPLGNIRVSDTMGHACDA